jgi:hypothetical protein
MSGPPDTNSADSHKRTRCLGKQRNKEKASIKWMSQGNVFARLRLLRLY